MFILCRVPIFICNCIYIYIMYSYLYSILYLILPTSKPCYFNWNSNPQLGSGRCRDSGVPSAPIVSFVWDL